MLQALRDEYPGEPYPFQQAVLVRVEEARELVSPSYALGKTEADLRREYRELSDAPGATPGALGVRAGDRLLTLRARHRRARRALRRLPHELSRPCASRRSTWAPTRPACSSPTSKTGVSTRSYACSRSPGSAKGSTSSGCSSRSRWPVCTACSTATGPRPTRSAPSGCSRSRRARCATPRTERSFLAELERRYGFATRLLDGGEEGGDDLPRRRLGPVARPGDARRRHRRRLHRAARRRAGRRHVRDEPAGRLRPHHRALPAPRPSVPRRARGSRRRGARPSPRARRDCGDRRGGHRHHRRGDRPRPRRARLGADPRAPDLARRGRPRHGELSALPLAERERVAGSRPRTPHR